MSHEALRAGASQPLLHRGVGPPSAPFPALGMDRGSSNGDNGWSEQETAPGDRGTTLRRATAASLVFRNSDAVGGRWLDAIGTRERPARVPVRSGASGLWPLAASGPAPGWEGPKVPVVGQRCRPGLGGRSRPPGRGARRCCRVPVAEPRLAPPLAEGTNRRPGRTTKNPVGRRGVVGTAPVRRPLCQPGCLALRGAGQNGPDRAGRL